MIIELRTLTGQVIPLPGKQEIEELQEQINHAQAKLEKLSRLKQSCQEEYIEKLHEYNEIKDFCLALLGKLAHMHGTTVGSLYSKFGLDPED